METLNFKTNLYASDDVAAVTLNLNDIEPVDGWNDRQTECRTGFQAVEQAGYWAETALE